MTFLKALTKGEYTIYIYSLSDDRYMIEYSNDGFGSKERKEYDSKEELLKMLKVRLELDQIKGIFKQDGNSNGKQKK